jgi:hypothetical protein
VLIALGVVGALLVFPACGGDKDAESGGETVACDGTPLSPDAIKLPADFPIPNEVTLTSSTKTGPSQVVNGYFEGDLEAAYHGFKDAFEGAGYTVLFDELEDQDSEVSYKTADGGSTGQVALRSDCEETGRTDVHITNRPA